MWNEWMNCIHIVNLPKYLVKHENSILRSHHQTDTKYYPHLKIQIYNLPPPAVSKTLAQIHKNSDHFNPSETAKFKVLTDIRKTSYLLLFPPVNFTTCCNVTQIIGLVWETMRTDGLEVVVWVDHKANHKLIVILLKWVNFEAVNIR